MAISSLKVLWLVLGNLVSKGAGLMREVLFAAWFGAGETAAGFRVAQTCFILPIHGFVGDTLSAGLLPLYRKLREEDADQARLLVLIAILYGLFFSGVITAGLFFQADILVRFVAPGASLEVVAVGENLLKVMALATPFYVLSGMLSYLEAAYGKFGAIAWRPLILNIGSIAGAALAVYFKQDHWLASALLASHVAFFCKTWLSIRALDRLTPETLQSRITVWTVTRRFFMNMLPLLGLPLVAQANMLVERMVSSWLGTVVIPSVDYSRALADTGVLLLALPLGILTMAAHGGQTSEAAQAFSRRAVSALIAMSFPAAAFLSLNAETIVTLLYARGRFDQEAVVATSSILVWMGAGVAFAVPAFYLVKVFNAQLRNREALAITIVGAVVNMTINLLGWKFFGPSILGIAVASQSLAMLALGLLRLRFARELASLFGCMVAGCTLQWGLHQLLATSGPTWERLALATFLAAFCWLPIFWFCAPVKTALLPLLIRVPGLRDRL